MFHFIKFKRTRIRIKKAFEDNLSNKLRISLSQIKMIAHVYGIKSVKLVILKVLTWLAHMSESWMTIAKLIKQKGH